MNRGSKVKSEWEGVKRQVGVAMDTKVPGKTTVTVKCFNKFFFVEQNDSNYGCQPSVIMP